MTMRTVFRLLIAAVLLALALSTAGAAEATRPLLLLFETVKGEGADKPLAELATRAIRGYFRETQKVDVALFDRESPTVKRAVMEKKLTDSKIASYASQNERVEVAGELGFQYAAGAEVTVKEVEVEVLSPGVVSVKPAGAPSTGETKPEEEPKAEEKPRVITSVIEVKVWVGRVNGGKAGRWEAIGSATAAGAGERDMENAMQSSASFAVNDIARRAFQELQRVAEKNPDAGAESTAIGAGQLPAAVQPSASDYAARAEESLKGGNTALAIQHYSQAVNADPTNGSLRMKLAEAYALRAMYTEAEDELIRAGKAGVGEDLIAEARSRIEAIRGGNTPAEPETGQVPPEPVQAEPSPRAADKPINGQVTPAVARMVQGDKLWSEGKPDEAAAAYAEAIKLDPADWRGYERLAVVNASISLFGESRKAVEMLAKIQPDPSAQTVDKRYDLLRKAFDKHFLALLRQYETDGADFEKSIITRESYYNSVKGLAIRLESMASFLDALTVPAAKQAAHLRRGVACGLAAQAAASLLDYLETNNEKAKSNAVVFATQARTEIDAASKLDENKVVVTQ